MPYAEYGKYGVDLFFALSGWLVGGLLWRELGQFGNLKIGQFILRRALRTIPPYLVALAIAWLGVKIFRQEPFNWGYLLFLQNYYVKIPYFLVSWSLCVEEHFYLIMPGLVLLLMRFMPNRYHLGFLVVALLPLACRVYMANSALNTPFGFSVTATHLRYDGLWLGVWAASLYYRHPTGWQRLQQAARFGLPLSLVGLLVVIWLPAQGNYVFFYLAVACFFLFGLVVLVGQKPVPGAASQAVGWLAAASYSLYLTHAFALDIALRILTYLPKQPVLQLVVISGAIFVTGLLFYQFIDLPSLRLRQYLMPVRVYTPKPVVPDEPIRAIAAVNPNGL